MKKTENKKFLKMIEDNHKLVEALYESNPPDKSQDRKVFGLAKEGLKNKVELIKASLILFL
jgi:hypothetical protein